MLYQRPDNVSFLDLENKKKKVTILKAMPVGNRSKKAIARAAAAKTALPPVADNATPDKVWIVAFACVCYSIEVRDYDCFSCSILDAQQGICYKGVTVKDKVATGDL